MGFQPRRAGPRPRALTTSRLCGRDFSPNAGMRCEAQVQAGTELTQLSKAKLGSGRTSVYPWLYQWTPRRECAGDETWSERSLQYSE